MTHASATGTINWLHFLAPVSGTCVMQIWHRIRLVPESSSDYNTFLFRARKWRARDWNDYLWSVHYCWCFYLLRGCIQGCYLFLSLFIYLVFLAVFIFRAKVFLLRLQMKRKIGTCDRKLSRFMAPFSGECAMHGPCVARPASSLYQFHTALSLKTT